MSQTPASVTPGPAGLAEPAAFADNYRQIIDARLQIARRAVADALQRCAGAPADGDARLGDAAHELNALSSACDLLLLGSRRWGPVRRLILGSTSETVIREAS